MAKASQPTVTLKHLAAGIATEHEMPKKKSETILTDFIDMIVKHLKKGDRIRIGGLCIPVATKSSARTGRTQATACHIQYKAPKQASPHAPQQRKTTA